MLFQCELEQAAGLGEPRVGRFAHKDLRVGLRPTTLRQDPRLPGFACGCACHHETTGPPFFVHEKKGQGGRVFAHPLAALGLVALLITFKMAICLGSVDVPISG